MACRFLRDCAERCRNAPAEVAQDSYRKFCGRSCAGGGMRGGRVSSARPVMRRRASRDEMEERAQFLIDYAKQHGPVMVRQLFCAAILEAARLRHLKSTGAAGSGTTEGRLPKGDFEALRKRLTEKRQSGSRRRSCTRPGSVVSMDPGAGLTMAQVFNADPDAQQPERFLLKLAKHWRDAPVEEVRPEAIRQTARKIYPHATEPTWNRQVIKPTQAAISYAADLSWCPRKSVKRFTENPEKKPPPPSSGFLRSAGRRRKTICRTLARSACSCLARRREWVSPVA